MNIVTSNATRLGALITGAMMMCTVSGAQAGLIGVKTIEITSALPDFLQISEIIALPTGGGADLALGATATTASFSVGFTTSEATAIDGVGPAAFPAIYHSGGATAAEFFTVTLNVAAELDSLEILGRIDNPARDVYNVVIKDDMGLEIFSTLTPISANNANNSAVISFVTSVPEPGSLALFGLGLAGLGVARRKRVA